VQETLLLMDGNGNVIVANEAAARRLGKPAKDLIGSRIYDFMPPDLAASRKERLKEATRAGTPVRFEDVRGDRHIESCIYPVFDAEGRVTKLGVFGMDITERKKAEEALRESEQRFRQVTENIREVFWLSNLDKTRIIYVSAGYEKVWGRSRDSLYQSPLAWVEAIHPEDRDRVLQAARTKQLSGQYDEEYRILRPDGSLRWIRDRAFPIQDETGAVYRVAGIAEDITRRKRAEEELRNMSRRILEVQEGERRRVARELHDGVNQIIASAKMRLCQLEASLAGSDPAAAESLRRCSDVLVQALEENRRIARNLHPTELDQLGLAVACRNLCEEVQSRTKLKVHCTAARSGPRLPLPVSLNLFRIAQEALNNIEQHARAKTIRLRITLEGRWVVLTIEDDGRGIRRRAAKAGEARAPGIGLANMRERAAYLGGTCQIESVPNQGTRITVRVPVAEPESQLAKPIAPRDRQRIGSTG
jgi:PAS domain S-box-containing protein